MIDRKILFATSFLRALATGVVGVILAIYLRGLGFSEGQIGTVITAGLLAGTGAIVWVTVFADRFGRKASLLILTGLGVAGGAAAALASSPIWMIAAAFFGLINGMGRDRGPAFVLEQAILPETVSTEDRTFSYAWYSLLQDVGLAVGGLLAGLPAWVGHWGATEALGSLRLTMGIYALMTFLALPLYLLLSPAIEMAPAHTRSAVSAHGKHVVWKISAVFSLDSFSSGFLATALIALFFYKRFGVNEAVVGALFFSARVANAISHPIAAWLAGRFGLLNTMVFTHIPSSIFLILAVLSSSFPHAAALFLLRELLVQMDVPTRQSFVMGVVAPGDRTYASGVTQIVRMGGWSIAPVIAGFFMQKTSLAAPLLLGAILKIGYDLALYASFRGYLSAL